MPVKADLSNLDAYVQGLPERARYDTDSVLFVNGMGHSMRMAPNERVTRYMFEESAAAKRGNFRNDTPDTYFLAGPVVILGEHDEGGGLTTYADVPDRLVEFFGASHQLGVERS